MPSDTESTTSPSTEPNDHIYEVMRALKNNDPKARALQPYLRAARWISLGINPYANLMGVFFTALQEDGEEDRTEPSEIDTQEELRIFEDIMKLIPSFKNVVAACSSHRRALVNLIHMLQDSTNSARNDDVSKTNACIVDYLIPCSEDVLTYSHDEFPLPGKSDYTDRGWSHPEYALLLYPQALLDHFSEAEYTNIMHDAEHGVIDISECEWPSYLYPQGTSPDVEDDQKGLFRGYLLPMVFRQIFTGPRSAMKPEMGKKGRSCKARLHHLTSVTGRTIAYTCVITRIAIRGLGWTLDDGAFEYAVFFQNIVRMFEEDPEDAWVKETLAWWNEQIPGLPRPAAGTARRMKKNKSGIADRIMDPLARRAAQRAAQLARQGQDTRTPTPSPSSRHPSPQLSVPSNVDQRPPLPPSSPALEPVITLAEKKRKSAQEAEAGASKKRRGHR